MEESASLLVGAGPDHVLPQQDYLEGKVTGDDVRPYGHRHFAWMIADSITEPIATLIPAAYRLARYPLDGWQPGPVEAPSGYRPYDPGAT